MNIQVALKKWKDTVSIESLRVEDIVEMLDCMAEHIVKLEAAQQSVQADKCLQCGTTENLNYHVVCDEHDPFS